MCRECVLYCTVLYCTVLYCIVLYCTVLYCTVLYLHLPAEGVADPADGCVGPPVLCDHVAVEVLAHDVNTVQLPVNTAREVL